MTLTRAETTNERAEEQPLLCGCFGRATSRSFETKSSPPQFRQRFQCVSAVSVIIPNLQSWRMAVAVKTLLIEPRLNAVSA
jgi:hypothetical protein